MWPKKEIDSKKDMVKSFAHIALQTRGREKIDYLNYPQTSDLSSFSKRVFFCHCCLFQTTQISEFFPPAGSLALPGPF